MEMRRFVAVLVGLLVASFWMAGQAQGAVSAAIRESNRGFELMRQGKVDEAIDAFQAAVRLDPAYATAYVNLGLALDKKDRAEDAIAAYQKALQLEPNNAFALNNLGLVYGKQGRFDQAIELYERAVAADPKDQTARTNLENTRKMKAEFEAAVAAAQEKVKADPADPNGYYNVARIYAFYNQKDQAIEWLQQALLKGFKDFAFARTDKAMDGVRPDPRYIQLMGGR